jgi:4-hydroxybenzoate polyprenyltransferase
MYYVGVAFAAGILIYEHSLVSPDNLELVNFAAFKINRYVSSTVFIMALLDIFLF